VVIAETTPGTVNLIDNRVYMEIPGNYSAARLLAKSRDTAYLGRTVPLPYFQLVVMKGCE
jgi:hypothetical protein